MKNILRSGLFVSLALMLVQKGFPQVTFPDNNPFGGRYLGFNGAQNLEFRTNDFTRMQLMQTGNSMINGFNVNRSGFLGLSQNPTFFTNGLATPFSLLHLNGDNGFGSLPQQNGYRDWMRYGLVFTHNRDLMYVGQRRRGAGFDVTDAVIAWADNTQGSAFGPDNLTFLFTTGTSTGPDLELGRMTSAGHTGIGNNWSNSSQPKRTLDVIRNDNDAQFRITFISGNDYDTIAGIHTDFQTSSLGNLHINPREEDRTRAVAVGFLDYQESSPTSDTRLDIVGLTRIRQIVDTTAQTLLIGYSREGINDLDTADQFVGRLDFPGDSTLFLAGDGTWLPGGIGDCRWFDVGSGTIPGEIDLSTGFEENDSCYRGKVVIGLDFAKTAKLESHNDVVRDATSVGSFSVSSNSSSDGDGGILIGAWGEARTINQDDVAIGVKGSVLSGGSAEYSIGLQADALGNPNNIWNIGTYSSAKMGPVGRDIAYYAEVDNPTDYALYLVGSTASISGPAIILSDQSVKTDINPIESASELLSNIEARSYYFVSPENRYIPFDEDLQFGFIAQQVQEVLPNLVREISMPELIDSTGVVEGSGGEFLGVKYDAFIPLLVAGFQEQNAGFAAISEIVTGQTSVIEEQATQLAEQAATIEALQAQMATVLQSVQAMQTKTANCCQENSSGDQGFSAPLEGQSNGEAPMKLAQNVPNPFSEVTRIDFELPRAAQVIMEISDAQGRPVEKLIDGQMPQGTHTIQWDGSQLAPGMYFYSLYANGELLTKKMIKR